MTAIVRCTACHSLQHDIKKSAGTACRRVEQGLSASRGLTSHHQRLTKICRHMCAYSADQCWLGDCGRVHGLYATRPYADVMGRQAQAAAQASALASVMVQ